MQGWGSLASPFYTCCFSLRLQASGTGAPRAGAARRAPIYALSLAVYCTSWTFFGSVGLSAQRGLEFLGIYIGPILVFTLGNRLLRHIVRLAKSEHITSIADFLAARYGKSFGVASLATCIAAVGSIPYIALQLKAVSGGVGLVMDYYGAAVDPAVFVFGDISCRSQPCSPPSQSFSARAIRMRPNTRMASFLPWRWNRSSSCAPS